LVVQPALWHNSILATLSIHVSLPNWKVPLVPGCGHAVVLDVAGSDGGPAFDAASPGGGSAFGVVAGGVVAGGVVAGGCGGMC